MEFSGKKVTVVGTGISGIGAVGLLNAVGAEVVLYDGNEKLKIEDIEKKLGLTVLTVIPMCDFEITTKNKKGGKR